MLSLCRLVNVRSCKFVLIPSVFSFFFLYRILFLCDWSIQDRCRLLLIYFYIGFLLADMYINVFFFNHCIYLCVMGGFN